MKKSEIYRKAQVAVLKTETIGVFEKLEVLRELMDREDTALFCEKREEEERVAQAV